MVDSVEGSISEVIARNDASGYTVVAFKDHGESARLVVFSATMPRAGERFVAQGEWTDHSRYGRQFSAAAFHVISPACREEIVTFLASGLFPGIGEGLARRVVEAFGEQTLDLIEQNPKLLYQVSGFGAAKVAGFMEAWSRHRGLREVTLALAPHGFSLSLAGKVWGAWSTDALTILKENPYRLYHEFSGASFHLVDRMARCQDARWADSIERCEAGLLDTLAHSYGDGHCCLPRAELLIVAGDILQVDHALLVRALEGMLQLGDAHEETWDGRPFIYAPKLRKAEEDAAKVLVSVYHSRAILREFAKDAAIDALALARSFSLSVSQRVALRTVLGSPLSILTGGPGTGKTRLTQLICDAARAAGIMIHLAAPTGRASRRLSDCTGLPASTIHRLLAFNPAFERFQCNAESPLARGLVLIDEASMLDLPLAAHLLRAVGRGSQIVFVGDVDQLPSVGPGAFLRDSINALPQCTARLVEIHRQSAGSWIVRNAHGFLRGKALEIPPRGARSDFQFRSAESDQEILQSLAQMLATLRSRNVNLMTDVQVLSPARKGPLGTTALNKYLQPLFNVGADQPTTHGLREGDRVVQKANDYEREVFNGHLGIVKKIDVEERSAVLCFEGKEHVYAFGDLDQVELAYALTSHKAQGGEFPIVLCVVHLTHGMLLSRQLLYTAITRAQKFLALIGDEKAIEIARLNASASERHGCLRIRINSQVARVVEQQTELLSA